MGIAQKLAGVGQKVSYLQKKGDNAAQHYRYARAEDVFQAVNKEMSARGIAVIRSDAEVLHVVQGLGKSGNGILTIVRIQQTYQDSESGETATFTGLGAGSDTQDKSVMKANTAALKYLMTNAFNISWGDDPEAVDPETGESTGKKRTRKTSKRVEAPILKAIDEAKTLDDLEPIKAQIQALGNQDPAYKVTKDAYVARKEALRQLEIPGA